MKKIIFILILPLINCFISCVSKRDITSDNNVINIEAIELAPKYAYQLSADTSSSLRYYWLTIFNKSSSDVFIASTRPTHKCIYYAPDRVIAYGKNGLQSAPFLVVYYWIKIPSQTYLHAYTTFIEVPVVQIDSLVATFGFVTDTLRLSKSSYTTEVKVKYK